MDATDSWLEECLEGAVSRDPGMEADLHTVTSAPDEKKVRKIPSKPHSTPQTLKWLEENYEFAEGVCIPRSALYTHYLDFCEKNDSQAVNAASFGKIIRQQFPQITTRRLGTRGQSKYHYYGIGVKETSKYYDVIYSKKGIQTTYDGKKETNKQIVAYSPRSKLGTLLPEFPSVHEVKLPSNIPEDKVATFLMMYRTHCQRILDTVIRANFDEVQSFLLHFWQGMPSHIVPILGTPVIVSLVGVCDSILYNALSGVLMPTVLQPLPESLTQVIRKFARQLDEWLHLALEDLPLPISQIKYELAHRFAQVLRRQTSLNHLCQAARTVIHSSDITSQMLEDWSHVDVNSICKQTLYTMDRYGERDFEMIVSLYSEFESLLADQAPLEAYTDWLDTLVDRCVVQPSSKKAGSLRRIARQFLLMWSCFGTRVIRDMTLHSAPSFGSFHLMHLMFDDYVLFLVESLHSRERTRDMLRGIKGECIPDSEEEMILPNPSLGSSFSITSGSACSSPVAIETSRQSVITDSRDIFQTHTDYRNVYSPDVASAQSNMTSYDAPMPNFSHTLSSAMHVGQENIGRESSYSYSRYGNTAQSVPTPVTSQNVDTASGYSYGAREYGYTSSFPQFPYGSRDGSGGCMSGLTNTMAPDWCENYQTPYPVVSGSGSHYGPHPSQRCHESEPATYSYDGNVNTAYMNSRHHRTTHNTGAPYQRYSDISYYGDNNMNGFHGKRRIDEQSVPNKRHMGSDMDYQFPSHYVKA